jgi:hypothetical protein
MLLVEALNPDDNFSQRPTRSPLLFIGRNRSGCWVVRDQSGMCGGLFVGRAEAFRFAMSETDCCPQAIVTVTGFLELDMSGSEKDAANDGARSQRHGPSLKHVRVF